MPHPLFDDKTGKQFAAAAERGDVRAMGRFLRDVSTRLDTLSETELAFTDGVTAGTGLASKALVLDSSGNVIMPDNGVFGMSRVSVAAIGSDAAGAAVLADQVNVVTASNGAKGVALPAAAITEGPIWVINSVAASALLVYPVSGGDDTINGSASVTLGPGQTGMFIPTSATEWYCAGVALISATATKLDYVNVGTLGTVTASKALTAGTTKKLLWTTTSSATSNPFQMTNTMTGVGTTGGRMLIEMTSNVTLGGWAQAIKAYTNFGAAGAVTGLASSINAEMQVGAQCSVTGTYAPLEMELVIATGGAGASTKTGFMYGDVSGADLASFNANGYLLMLGAGITSGTDDLFEAETKSTIAKTHTLRINIAGTNYFIALHTAKAFGGS